MKQFTAFLLGAFLLFGLITRCRNQVPPESETFQPFPEIIEEVDVQTLAIGAPMPLFELHDMNGEMVSHLQFEKAELLVVAFICNHCPTAQAYEDRLVAFANDFKEQNVQLVAINPNSPLALLPEECSFSDLDDTFETMAIRAKYKGYNFPYLYDGDNHSVSLKFGPVTTPHVFVFDAKRVLRYEGRLDGIERPGEANADDLRNAVGQLLANEPVVVESTKTFGCSVKWSWKADWAQKANEKWENREVKVNWINSQGVADLMKNQSENLRLINVWATWCAPCVLELPDLILMHRIYQGRGFELITISADKNDNYDRVLKMLMNNHASTENYIFNLDDSYQLIDAVDPEWKGALPYSLLIEPGGKIIYRHQGGVDPLKLRRVIVEHSSMGRFY